MCQIWDSQRREYMAKNLPKREWRFQPIIPIMFYTGDQKWETVPSLATLMDLPAVLNRFIPSFDVLLLDVRRASDETLLKSDHPFGWLLTVLKQETADTKVFVDTLMRFGDHQCLLIRSCGSVIICGLAPIQSVLRGNRRFTIFTYLFFTAVRLMNVRC